MYLNLVYRPKANLKSVHARIRYFAGGAMADEYGEMDSSDQTYVRVNYKLESGVVLP